MSFQIASVIQCYLRLGTIPGDPENVRLGKAQLMGSSTVAIVGSFSSLVQSILHIKNQKPDSLPSVAEYLRR